MEHMEYQEYILVFLTIILGLAITNLYQGIGTLVKTKISGKLDIYPAHVLLIALIFMAIVDTVFFGFADNYINAKKNIWILIMYIIPPSCLYFSTLFLFPSSIEITNTKKYFIRHLRLILSFQLLFIISITAIGYSIIGQVINDGNAVPFLVTQSIFAISFLFAYVLRTPKFLFWVGIWLITIELFRWIYLSMDIYKSSY